MTAVYQENDEVNELNVVEQAQIESLFGKLRFNETKRIAVEDNILKSVVNLEESGGDIDEIFLKLYGEPSEPISIEEQGEILERERLHRKELDNRLETEEDTRAINTASDDNTKTEKALADEDIIESKTVTAEEATEVDWDDVFDEMAKSEATEKSSTEPIARDSSCVIV